MAWFDPPLYKRGNKKCPKCGQHQGNFRSSKMKLWYCTKCGTAMVYDRGRLVVNILLVIPFLALTVLLLMSATVGVWLLGFPLLLICFFALGWWLDSYQMQSSTKEAPGEVNPKG